MSGLQVLSAPPNQPTLNPIVQSAPVQPTLAPRVLSTPQNAPTLAPKVQTQPAQPTLVPQVQSQPQGQQENLPISYGKAIDAIVAAKSRGADANTIIKAIIAQNPEKAPALETALQRGATPDEILAKIIQDNYSPSAGDPAQQQPGFVQGLIRGIVNPFARFGVSIANAGGAAYEGANAAVDYAIGNQAGGQQHAQNAAAILDKNKTGVGLGYLGPVKGIQKPGLDAAGAGAEVAANFIGGEGAVAAGERVAKGSLKQAIGIGIKEGAKAGGVAGLGLGLQQDNPTAGSVIKNAAEGVVGGAATGGALATVPALAVESYRFTKGLKNFIHPDVEAAFMKALKPGTNNTTFKQAIKLSTPLLSDTEQTLNQPVKNLSDLLSVIKATRQRIWTTVQQRLGDNADLSIDGNKVADAMIASIDKRFSTQNPAATDRIAATADTYRRAIPVQEAEAFLESANNDLQNFYAKSGFKQRADARNPEIGHVVREADALRTLLNEKISSATGKDFGLLKKQYGALSNLEQVTTKRVNVAERQNPDSFTEQFSNAQAAGKVLKSIANRNFGDAIEGAGQAVTAHLIKVRNTSDALIEHAFNQLRKGAPKLKP